MTIIENQYSHIDDVTAKVVETGQGFLLNTQYYLKNNMSPVPFENKRIYGSSYQLDIYKNAHCETYSWNKSVRECPPIRDEFVPNRYYIFNLVGYKEGGRRTQITTYDEVDGQIKQWRNSFNYDDIQFYKQVYQTEQYLYWTALCDHRWYLHRYDKINNSNTTCIDRNFSYSRPCPELIYKDDTYFIFATYCDNQIQMTKYYLGDNRSDTCEIYRGNMSQHDNYRLSQTFFPIKINDNEYGVIAYNCMQQEQPLGLYSVDITKPFTTTWDDACKYTPCTITWNSSKDRINYNTSTHTENTFYEFVKHTINDIDYIHLCVYNKNFENSVYIAQQGIYTFKMNSNTSLEFINYSKIDASKQINGFIFDDTQNILIVAISKGFEIFNFNNIIKNYEPTTVSVGDVSCVGLDENNRLWYIKTNGSTHLVNVSDAQDVDIVFEKPYYEYVGNVIETYLDFSALTYLGTEAQGTFRLVMEGPATFKDNHLKNIEFSYPTTKRIELEITGAAPITVYPKYISN